MIYLEILFTKITRFFGIKKSTKPIPDGLYCYVYDGRTGVTESGLPWHGIKNCKYYRYLNGDKRACTYIGFVGFDFCLFDNCKMCGVKDDLEEDEMN